MSDPKDPGSPGAPADWEARYQEGRTGWDLGGPAPALVGLLASLEGPLRVLVPGCGYGHDALAWAAAGHEVVGVDVAPSAIAGAQRLATERGLDVDFRLGDIFALPEDLAPFDVVWEQTCFCALQPVQRPTYVEAMAGALAPGGRLFGVLWNHGMEAGPPFDVTRADIEAVFPARFTIDAIDEVAESAPGRWDELLVRMTVR